MHEDVAQQRSQYQQLVRLLKNELTELKSGIIQDQSHAWDHIKAYQQYQVVQIQSIREQYDVYVQKLEAGHEEEIQMMEATMVERTTLLQASLTESERVQDEQREVIKSQQMEQDRLMQQYEGKN